MTNIPNIRYKLYLVGAGTLTTCSHVSKFYNSIDELWLDVIKKIVKNPSRLRQLIKFNNQFVIQCYTDQYIAEIYNVFKFSQLQLDDNGELELVFLN